MQINNPFAFLGAIACGIPPLPLLPIEQDGTCYPQLDSEVSGLIILPKAAVLTDWTDAAEWRQQIDNSVNAKGRYLTGIGSFLPESSRIESIADGRYQAVSERKYKLSLRVLNVALAHIDLACLFTKTPIRYRVWLETIEGRLIGGENGLIPDLTDATLSLNSGASKEAIDISMTFSLKCFPKTTMLSTSISNVTPKQYAWGTHGANIWGDTNSNNAWGWYE
jgi:hypothetical protein